MTRYSEIRWRLVKDTGWTFDAVDCMSFEQIADALAEGKHTSGMEVHSIEDVHRIARDWRKLLGV